MANILVTGGAGYVGSVCCAELLRLGHSVTIVDDLSTGCRDAVPAGAAFFRMDIGNQSAMQSLVSNIRFDAVFHFAAKALIPESVSNPGIFFQHNVASGIVMLEVLRAAGWPDDVCRAILGHATYSGVPRDTDMARALFACDELCGFLVACSLVMADRSIAGVEVASVKKKLKRADFARNVNRDDIEHGTAELGVDLDEHIAFTLGAMRGIAAELGL